MWLSPKIFEWDRRVCETGSEDKSWRRAHTIWSHAEHLLEQANTELFRVDAITTLKRSIDHRLRLLDKIYEFRNIPIRSKPSDKLELLDSLGIVRPKMFQKLNEIRNAVEHEDANPPSDEACFVFLEFTWYFLRSTDLLVRQPTQSIQLFPFEDESYYDATIELDPKEGWIPKLTAWIVSSMISEQPVDDWLTLKVDKTETRGALVAREGKFVNPTGWDSGRGKNADDTYVEAEIRGPSHQLLKLYQFYFDTV